MRKVCPNIYWKLLIEERESFVLKKYADDISHLSKGHHSHWNFNYIYMCCYLRKLKKMKGFLFFLQHENTTQFLFVPSGHNCQAIN